MTCGTTPTVFSLTSISASDNGTLAFRTGGIEKTELLWLDRRGNVVDRVWEPANYLSVSLSPDGQQAMLGRASEQDPDRKLWLYDLQDDTPVQFSVVADSGFTAAWSPDGSRVMYTAFRDTGAFSIWERPVTGGTQAELRGPTGFVSDWADDDSFVVYQKRSGEFWNIALLNPNDDSDVRDFKPSSANQLFGQVSPNGRWLAYQSDETGSYEIYAESFPEPGISWKISTGGGHQPVWHPDGDELFYLAPDRTLMAVRFDPNLGYDRAAPSALFQTPIIGLGDIRLSATYVVGPRGETFLINSRREQQSAAGAVILNGLEERQ